MIRKEEEHAGEEGGPQASLVGLFLLLTLSSWRAGEVVCQEKERSWRANQLKWWIEIS